MANKFRVAATFALAVAAVVGGRFYGAAYSKAAGSMSATTE